MSENDIDYTPAVLRNKGIPCEFAVAVRGEDDWVKKYDDTVGDFEKEIRLEKTLKLIIT